MKASIIGASGKVGSELTRLLAEQTLFSKELDIVLYRYNFIRKKSASINKGYSKDKKRNE